MQFFVLRLLAITVSAFSLLASPSYAQDNSIVVSSTTSTEQSGLFGFILPIFKMKTGINVKVVAVGTGQALDIGRRGDADVVFVHDKPAEEIFVQEGYSTKRNEVMYNDFVLIGPKSDPAKVAAEKIFKLRFKKSLLYKRPLSPAAIRVALTLLSYATGKAPALLLPLVALGIKKLAPAWGPLSILPLL